MSRKANIFEKLVYSLVLILVFEGIMRKLIPALSLPIFFIKDLICALILGFAINKRLTPLFKKVKSRWTQIAALFIPLLLFTAAKDPILAVFASKQYLLYMVVGLGIALSFPSFKEENLRKFIFFITLLLVPTTMIAIIQNGLPATHWLNRSVGGETLEAFSAAGYLRVSSTFSFTAQYSWFLNAETYFLILSFFMTPRWVTRLTGKKLEVMVYLFLALMLLVGAFVTGGRTAVIGCGGVSAVTLGLIGLKRPQWALSKGAILVVFALVSLAALRIVRPQYFSAYEKRSEDTEDATSNEKLVTRILNDFTGFTSWFVKEDVGTQILGNGLGIMSNGSVQVSSYAADIRSKTWWTEGEVATTFWEGGIYLAMIWYTFRISMIIFCYKLWRSIKSQVYSSAAAGALAYIIILGIIGQFGLQPPLSCWWWLAIGTLGCIYQIDRYKIGLIINRIKKQQHAKTSTVH